MVLFQELHCLLYDVGRKVSRLLVCLHIGLSAQLVEDEVTVHVVSECVSSAANVYTRSFISLDC